MNLVNHANSEVRMQALFGHSEDDGSELVR